MIAIAGSYAAALMLMWHNNSIEVRSFLVLMWYNNSIEVRSFLVLI
jgi:hypothetical protein